MLLNNPLIYKYKFFLLIYNMKKIILSIIIFIVIIFLLNYDQLKVDILTNLVISRGVVALNCFWYKTRSCRNRIWLY